MTAAPKKPKVSPEIYKIIEEKMALEIALYEIAKKRFYLLKQELLLRNRLPDFLYSIVKKYTRF